VKGGGTEPVQRSDVGYNGVPEGPTLFTAEGNNSSTRSSVAFLKIQTMNKVGKTGSETPLPLN
jgi:hypothetical protein